ncbi:MAG: hypothetical protein AAF919_15735 [Pseudomonadota bacterium]
MRFHLAAAAIVASAITAPVAPALADGHTASTPGQIRISCERYFFTKRVIWDRPKVFFIDDLVAIGYDYEQASAIANRVCRDESLIGNEEGLAATMQTILRNSPPGRR